MRLAFLERLFRERKIYLRVLNELSSGADRELSELGFARVDIPCIAPQSAREA